MKNGIISILLVLLTGLSCTPVKEYHPLAIAMWDFSWLERRWPGAGFEDWDQVLDEFTERGYNAVRIEAYPQLIAADPEAEWVLEELWNTQVWGSPDVTMINVQPALNQFVSKCRDHGVMVGLSSWYRKDTTHQELSIKTPEDLADIWIATLRSIEVAGLLDTILYVDLCNEWPRTAFFNALYPEIASGQWDAEASQEWMRRAIERISAVYPDMPLSFSFDTTNRGRYDRAESGYLDFFEHHIWMMKENKGDFRKAVKYDFQQFSPEGYKNLVKYAEPLYRSNPEYWNGLLRNAIYDMAEISARLNKPLITTECWAVVDYKDWPMLKWDWVKDMCQTGVETSAATGQWVAIATSNFCEPQFVGMWRDIEWHKKMTSTIRNAKINPELLSNPQTIKLLERAKKLQRGK
jgi:hypothetical protein